MRDWMDFDGDGEVDSCERMFAEEMLCTSKEEHEALFGDAGDFDDDMEDDFEIDAMAAGLLFRSIGAYVRLSRFFWQLGRLSIP